MSRDTAIGVGMTCIVVYEAAAFLLGAPKVTELSRRYPPLAYMLAGAWLAHVFWQAKKAVAEVIEEMEACEEWH